jgi:hypothetical protein
MAEQIPAQSIQVQGGSVLRRIRGQPLRGNLRCEARCNRLHFAGQNEFDFDGGARGRVYRFW